MSRPASSSRRRRLQQRLTLGLLALQCCSLFAVESEPRTLVRSRPVPIRKVTNIVPLSAEEDAAKLGIETKPAEPTPAVETPIQAEEPTPAEMPTPAEPPPQLKTILVRSADEPAPILSIAERPKTGAIRRVTVDGDMNENPFEVQAIPHPGKVRRDGSRLAQAAQPPRNDPDAPAVDLTNPFEVISEQNERLVLMVRRSMLMRTKVDIYRTATVDPGIVEVVQFTPREVSLIGKSVGSTHITFWFDQPGSRPVTYLVRVEPDVEQVKVIEDQYRLLEDVINEMFPDSKIELVVLADKLIVKGQAKDGEDAAQILALVRGQGGGGQNFGGGGGGQGGGLNGGAAANVLDDSVTGSAQRSRLQVINMLRVPGIQQVSLRVKIAELNRTAARGFGVSVNGAANLDGFANGSKLFFNSLVNAANGQGPAILARVDGDDISIGIKYLQQHGVLRLLSEPTLVTMSGRPATFVAGGEIAVPTVVGAGGVNAITTDFRAFGAIISFVPTVLDKDRIRLSVAPEFSQIDAGNAVGGTPGFKVRSATTTVEMREGQTLAIAGLLEDNMTSNKRGDIPFVSWLFGDRSVSHTETELIILVTPDLVHPMEPEEVPPLPGFDVTEPDNNQFFFQGRLEGNPTYDYRSTVWPRLRKRYGAGGSAMTSGPFGHGQ